jgi:hypothetical protein
MDSSYRSARAIIARRTLGTQLAINLKPNGR